VLWSLIFAQIVDFWATGRVAWAPIGAVKCRSRLKLAAPIVREHLWPLGKADNPVAVGLFQRSSVLRRSAMAKAAVALAIGFFVAGRVISNPTVAGGRKKQAVVTGNLWCRFHLFPFVKWVVVFVVADPNSRGMSGSLQVTRISPFRGTSL